MSLRERLSRLDTPALSDALDRLGIDGQVVGIAPLDRSFRLVGQAFTVRMLPVGTTGRNVGDYIDDVRSGDVVVIDNGGRRDATVWGDILTTVAHRDGVAGTVIDGVCRDVGRSLDLGYPIYARDVTMRTGKDRVCAEAFNEAVQLAGVRVEPGDWLRGDADGIVVLPLSLAERIVDVAEEIDATEEAIRVAVGEGGALLDARRRSGYHALQTRRATP
ncbi:RraA family protein [Desertimonas flava]|uniref:RraA family protein n=1 Tax=Desertimonas flava TaxID=2064846 RepID=UPI000E35159E|nr:RraA family protein [Desertimonas flava]